MAARPLTFAVLGADHGHIYGMYDGMIAAGAVCKGWWTMDKPEPSRGADPFPGVTRFDDPRPLLDDPDIDLMLIAAMPSKRAGLAIDAMSQGKDVMVDKPGATRLEDMATIRKTVTETGRLWSVTFSERYRVRAAVKAAELVAEGAIGRVLQTVGLGPHRGLLHTRADWFFEPQYSGGILGDLAAHQIDHFLFFTGSTTAEIAAAAVANFNSPQHPRFEDFGELLLRGDNGQGYARVDWQTPDAQSHPGDSRLFILGTEGQIEIRKYVDVDGRPGGDHLFLIQGARAEHVDCSQTPIIYFRDFANDVRDRTHTAASQEHSFVATELSIKAEAQAVRLGHLALQT